DPDAARNSHLAWTWALGKRLLNRTKGIWGEDMTTPLQGATATKSSVPGCAKERKRKTRCLGKPPREAFALLNERILVPGFTSLVTSASRSKPTCMWWTPGGSHLRAIQQITSETRSHSRTDSVPRMARN